MDGYGKFKAELDKLCERGKISKVTKKRLCRFTGGAGETAYNVCTELLGVFETVPRDSAEYAEVSECAIELLTAAGEELNLKRDAEVVCDFIRLTVETNRSDAPSEKFGELKSCLAEYNKSLQSIKYGLPLF